jgi:hypothetical protein
MEKVSDLSPILTHLVLSQYDLSDHGNFIAASLIPYRVVSGLSATTIIHPVQAISADSSEFAIILHIIKTHHEHR